MNKKKRAFDSENCVFQNNCKKYGTPDCFDPCWRQREFYFLLDNSNLSELHKTNIKLVPMEEDLKVFEYLDFLRQNIVKFVQGGQNLLIRGATGNGKTVWVTKLIRAYLLEKSINNGYKERALFINLPWFITNMRHNISEQSEYFTNLRKLCYNIDLLVLDDIGAVSLKSDFIHDEIYSIVNQRIDNGMSNIYTTNLSNKELELNLGPRLSGRIIGISECITIKNKVDLRKPQSNLSFDAFAGGINNGK